jgi:Flp pilus assembly protein TadD
MGPTLPASDGRTKASPTCGGDLGATQNTKLDTIQQMVDDGKPYAALAEMDALGVNTPRLALLRADAWRKVGRLAEARTLYTGLLGSCLEGRALHGLGLLAAQGGELRDALERLLQARQRLPTDAVVRSDLGYALMLDKQWEAARFEMLTALDLSPNDPKPARNLVLLAWLEGEPDLARRLADKFNLPPETRERLAKQAAQLANATPRGPAGLKPAATPAAGQNAAPPEPVAPIPPLTPPASEAS